MYSKVSHVGFELHARHYLRARIKRPNISEQALDSEITALQKLLDSAYSGNKLHTWKEGESLPSPQTQDWKSNDTLTWLMCVRRRIYVDKGFVFLFTRQQ